MITMMNKKIIKSLSVFVSLFLLNSLLLITGIGIILSLFSKDSDYIKKKHGSIKVFSADLNHNGIIEDNEKNLTWSESFDKLLEQAGDFEELKKIADNMGIVESDKNIACKLARYEILHQCFTDNCSSVDFQLIVYK